MLKKLLLLVGSVMFAMTLPLMAETKTVGDYTYNYIDNGDGTVTLSHYDEKIGRASCRERVFRAV